MKLRNKIHNYLQKKALDKAILDLVGHHGYSHINMIDNKVYFYFTESKTKLLKTLEFNLPSCAEIKELAKKKYKKFDDSFIEDIIYSIKYVNGYSKFIDSVEKKDLILVAKDSDIELIGNAFKKIDINSKGNVKIYSCFLNSDLNINAKTIILEHPEPRFVNSINLNAEYVEIKNTYNSSTNLNIKSKLLAFNNTDIYSKNINLKAEMIDTKNTSLKATNKIEINNTNCDEIKEVDSPVIIYNGQDISYSEGIVKPKLIGNLIRVLKEIKFQVCSTIENSVETETEKYKQNLESNLNSEPITKVLKK